MRVTCASTPSGHVYDFYRNEQNFSNALRRLVRFLLDLHAEIVLSPDRDDSAL